MAQAGAGPDRAAVPGKKKIRPERLEEARALIWLHRKRMGLGLALMIVNRLAGLVLPTTSKFLMDNVILRNQWELLPRLALAAGAATLVESVTSFSLSQVLGVAAQRAITEMRKDVEAHVMRLPVRYFDSTKTGVLISRIMTDAEGIRNLVGSGLVQLTGSILTAVLALDRADLPELAADSRHHRRPRRVRRRHGHGVQAAAAAVPRTGQDQCGSDGPARRNSRRRPDRQGLHGGKARRARVRKGRAQYLPQRGQVDDRCVQRIGLLHGGARRDRHFDDARRRQPIRAGP